MDEALIQVIDLEFIDTEHPGDGLVESQTAFWLNGKDEPLASHLFKHSICSGDIKLGPLGNSLGFFTIQGQMHGQLCLFMREQPFQQAQFHSAVARGETPGQFV
ncbi:MAG: hypothetical protein IMF11_02690 [Proteobacteria bacterium]|nr:hypothetical protein [Pseudomonadota bacterium]